MSDDPFLIAWRPIETAPRDGTQVFLFIPEFAKKVQVGHFVNTEHFSHGVSTYKRKCWHVAGSMSFMDRDPNPSHWMPIPDPERAA